MSIQYACNEAGLRIPWDGVAKLMGEKFSDGAIVQHMSKLRQKMVENDLPVPPPLKRGTTVVPSKIYASSGTARRKSMPDTPTATSAMVTTPKSKQSASKKRNRRSGVDSDSDSQPNPDEMDIGDTSDDEYGASGKKKKKQTKAKKVTKKRTVQEPMELDGEDTEQIKKEDAFVKSQAVEEGTIKESIETPGPASRTRGVRQDYSKLEQASDEEEDDNGDEARDGDGEEADDEDAVVEDDTEDPKIKSDGEVSPRSKVPFSPATPAHLIVQVLTCPLTIERNTDLLQGSSTLQNSPRSSNSVGMHTPYLAAAFQYHSPQNNLPGVPQPGYFPRSTMTSFSTNRNDSAGSLTSSMPPTFSSQSSFSHAGIGQMPFSAHPDYFNPAGLEFQDLGGFTHDSRHGEGIFRPQEDGHDDFGGLFDANRKPY